MGICLSILRTLDFSPGFSRPPSPSHPSATAEQWADVWQSLLLFLFTHTQIQCCLHWYCLVNVYSPPTLWMTFQYCLGVCITSASLWVQINSVCASSDWLFCVFLCIVIKAVRKHHYFLRLSFSYYLCFQVWFWRLFCLFSSLGCTWQLYMMQYSLPLKTNMLICPSPWSCAWHLEPASD